MTGPYIVDPSPTAIAVYDAATQTLRATLPAQVYDRRLGGLNIQGPSGSTFDLYFGPVMDQNRRDSTLRGQSNTADYPNPYYVGRGVTITGVWRGVVSTNTASINFRFLGNN